MICFLNQKGKGTTAPQKQAAVVFYAPSRTGYNQEDALAALFFAAMAPSTLSLAPRFHMRLAESFVCPSDHILEYQESAPYFHTDAEGTHRRATASSAWRQGNRIWTFLRHCEPGFGGEAISLTERGDCFAPKTTLAMTCSIGFLASFFLNAFALCVAADAAWPGKQGLQSVR